MLTSRSFETVVFLPGQSQQNTLSQIYSGSRNELFTLDDAKWGQSELCNADQRELIKEDAQAYYDSMVKRYQTDSDYIVVNGPMRFSKEEYLVEIELTSLGQAALKVLESGYVWNHKLKSVSLEETLIYYRSALQRASVDRRDIKAALHMAKIDPNLKELAGIATYVIMRGESNGAFVTVRQNNG